MDIEEFIKVEESHFNNAELTPNYFPHDFYHQDSASHDQRPQYSIEEIIAYATELDGFVDMPMDEIVATMAEHYPFESFQLSHFRRRVKKTKNILKRSRAKARNVQVQVAAVERKQVLACEESSLEKETQQFDKQIKKKRNRISAQISRDRKKDYVANLQMSNKTLEAQAESLRRENERLQKQIDGSNSKNKPKDNKIIKLLLLLGIVFFFYILQDIFHIKLNQKPRTSLATKEELSEQTLKMVGRPDSYGILKQIQEEMESEQGESLFVEMGSGFKEAVMQKIAQIQVKAKELVIPQHLLATLMQAKASI